MMRHLAGTQACSCLSRPNRSRRGAVNKVTLVLLAVILLGLYGGSVAVFGVLWFQENGRATAAEQRIADVEQQAAQKAKADAEQQVAQQVAYLKGEVQKERDRADEASRKAAESVNPMPKPPESIPQAAPTKVGLLDETADFYRQVLQAAPDHPDVARETARLYTWSAAAYQRGGNLAKADQLYKEGIDLLTKLEKKYPLVPECRHELARALVDHGMLIPLLKDENRAAETGTSWLRALSLQEGLVKQFPNVPTYRQELAQMYNNLAGLLQANNKTRDASEAYNRAQALQEKLTAEAPTNPDYQSELGATLDNLAYLLSAQGRGPDADKARAQSIRHHRAAVKGNANNPTYWERYCRHYYLLGEVLKHREAYADLRTAVDEMIKGWPESWRVYTQTAEFLAGCVAHIDKNSVLAETRKKEHGEALGKRAVDLLRDASRKKELKRYDADRKEVPFADYLTSSTILEPLRARPDFQKLVSDLEAAPK